MAMTSSLSDAPDVEVIIPAHNAEAYIDRCLDGLFAAGFSPARVHVVDDGSSDDTVKKCLAAGITPMRSTANLGAAAARNFGAESCSADILLFLDADVVIAPDAIEVIKEFFQLNPEITAVFGCYDEAPAHPARVSRIRNLLHRHVHLRHAGEAVTFWTGCGAVRREAFENLGGFHPDQSMMEDVRFGMDLVRQGYRIHLLPALQGKHLKRWTLLGMVRTDLFDRAIPWSRLLRSNTQQGLPNTLNVDLSARLSVASVGMSLLGTGLMLFAPQAGAAVALMALLVLLSANRSFLTMIWRLASPLDALVAVPVLWLHYLCAGLGYAMVRAGF